MLQCLHLNYLTKKYHVGVQNSLFISNFALNF